MQRMDCIEIKSKLARKDFMFCMFTRSLSLLFFLKFIYFEYFLFFHFHFKFVLFSTFHTPLKLRLITSLLSPSPHTYSHITLVTWSLYFPSGRSTPFWRRDNCSTCDSILRWAWLDIILFCILILVRVIPKIHIATVEAYETWKSVFTQYLSRLPLPCPKAPVNI